MAVIFANMAVKFYLNTFICYANNVFLQNKNQIIPFQHKYIIKQNM